MGLRVNTNIAALGASRTLRGTTNALNRSLERLSSGLRINRARDDAAGLAIAEGFRSFVRGSIVAQRNAQDGIAFVQTADGALEVTAGILQRMRELAVQAANGTYSDENRESLQEEVEQLLEQIDQIANNTEFNGVAVLNSVTPTTLQVGVVEGQTLEVTPVVATAVALGVDGVDISTQAGAQAAITTINEGLNGGGAVDSVNALRATLGAQQNRLEFTVTTLQIQEENSAFAESQIRDADIARETIDFTRNQILVSAGTSILAQSNVIPQTALQLLGG